MESPGIEFGLISKIKWYQRKSEVRDLTLEMGALQNSLALLLATVTYEIQIRQGAGPEALTMAQITNFIEGAEVIASKFDKLAGAHSATERTLQHLLGNVVYVADGQLDVANTEREATGLYEPGRWVLKKEADPMSHENRRRRRSRIETRPQERPPRRTRPEERRTRSPRPPRPPNEGIFINIPPPNQPKGKERQTDPEPPEASSSRGVENPAGSNRLDSQNAIVVTENDQSTQPLTHLSQGAALSYVDEPSASDEYQHVNGQISRTKSRDSRSSSRTITARLYPNFGMNAMSQAMAEQLGLNITVHFDRDFARNLPVTGATQAEVNHAVGHVTFVWQTAAHILVVPCTVVEQEVLPGVALALGKPYVQQVETAGGVVRGESFRTSSAS
ncbi:hypothetical protein V502_10620 [Pseudogymnoascus sp. VKM F-4520 (FW-2644)]|nr:hypothetical protein V502_10620 [Pseudogymnoascus sp. VKM F-4520 (FW-2644)]